MIPEDVKINPAKKEKRRKVVTENMIRAGIFFQPNAVSQLLSVWNLPLHLVTPQETVVQEI